MTNFITPNPGDMRYAAPADSLRGPAPAVMNTLTNGEKAVLAIDQALPGLDLTRITGQVDTPGFTTVVVGELKLGKSKDPNDESRSIAVVKSTSPQGVDSLLLMGLVTDENGDKKQVSGTGAINIPPGLDITLGRETAENAADVKHIGGTKLFGAEFGVGVSRNHVKICWDGQGKGLVIEDTSTNGTRVSGAFEGAAEAEPRPAQTAVSKSLGAVGMKGGQALISEVPVTAEEAKRAMQKSRQAEIAGPLAELDRQIQETEIRMKALESPLSEKDRNALWRYASNTMNGELERKKGGSPDASRIYQQNVGDAIKDMSPYARGAASDYTALMKRLDGLRNHKDRLEFGDSR